MTKLHKEDSRTKLSEVEVASKLLEAIFAGEPQEMERYNLAVVKRVLSKVIDSSDISVETKNDFKNYISKFKI